LAAAAAGTYSQAERLLGEQLEQLRRGNLEAVRQLGARIQAALDAMSASELPPDAETRRRLARLQDALELSLAQQRGEVSAKRALLRQGHATLQAYRRGT
jgi:hypothetical protein